MKKLMIVTFVVVAGMSVRSWGAGESLKVTEKLNDKVACYNDSGDKFCDQFTTGSFSVKAKVFTNGELDGFEPDASTPFSISVGDWSYEGFLGDDPKFQAGKKKATIKLFHEVCGDIDCKDVAHGKITLSGGGGLKVSISCKAGTDKNYNELESFIAAPNEIGAGDENGLFGDVISATISIGDLTTTTDVVITGVEKTKTVTKGSGDNQESFDLASVKLKGAPPSAP